MYILFLWHFIGVILASYIHSSAHSITDLCFKKKYISLRFFKGFHKNLFKSIDPVFTIAFPLMFITVSILTGSYIPFLSANKRTCSDKTPIHPIKSLIITLSGPFFNILTAALAALITRFNITNQYCMQFLGIFIFININIAIIHLLPFSHLDGFNILKCIAKTFELPWKKFSSTWLSSYVLFTLYAFGITHMVGMFIIFLINLIILNPNIIFQYISFDSCASKLCSYI